MNMIGSLCLHLSTAPPLNYRREAPPNALSLIASLTKQGQRFISSLSTTADPKTASRLIGKFVTSSSQFIALNALSHLLSPETNHPHLSSLALPLYSRITEQAWFQWNPKLVAELIALLDKRGENEEAESFVHDAVSKFEFRERDLVQFYGNLIDSFCKQKSELGFEKTYCRLNRLVSASFSVYVKRQGYKSMISGLCEMCQPEKAENLIEDMKGKGIKPSSFEFKSIVYGYGRLGFFEGMERIISQMVDQGFEIDTVCANMVLSSYGDHKELSRMVSWLRKMKYLGISFSIRTYNSVLNSCPTLISMIQDCDEEFPVSIAELKGRLNGEEVLAIEELMESSVLDEAMKWDSVLAKLDLHGMHLSSAYLVMLQWMEMMKQRLSDGENVIPGEVTVVCGSGKHSSVRGESPVKGMVKKMVIRTKSPLRIDRKNIGCFVAKGHVVKNWLC